MHEPCSLSLSLSLSFSHTSRPGHIRIHMRICAHTVLQSRGLDIPRNGQIYTHTHILNHGIGPFANSQMRRFPAVSRTYPSRPSPPASSSEAAAAEAAGGRPAGRRRPPSRPRRAGAACRRIAGRQMTSDPALPGPARPGRAVGTGPACELNML